MPNVILQPCANKGSRVHYQDTIENPVFLNSVSQFLRQDDIDHLSNIYPDGRMRVWGVTPGVNGVNIGKWNKIDIGDVTLLAAGGKIFASAVTTLKLHNKQLASSLWGTDENSMTWEYIYFISDVF